MVRPAGRGARGRRRGRSRFDDRGAASALSLALAGSLLAGSVGVGFVAQRTVLADEAVALPEGGAVPVHVCPGEPAVGALHPGDRVFATAVHDELDGWLRIRNPIAPDERWWIESRHVGTDAPTDELPATGCDDDGPATDPAELADAPDDEPTPDEPAEGEVEVALGPGEEPVDTVPGEGELPLPPGVVPAPAPGFPAPAPSPTPGSPTPAPTAPPRPGPGPTSPPPPPPPTTAAPDTTPPSLNVSRSQAAVWETSPGLCLGKPSSSVISANASDPSGISQLRATWSVGNHNESRSLLGGSTTFGPYAYPTIASNQQVDVVITVRATDGAGNTATRTTTVRLHSAAQCFG